jgi:uncharacterized protein
MTIILRNIAVLVFSAMLLTTGYSQTTNIFGQDAASQLQLLTYRKVFWDSLPIPIGRINDYEGLYTNEEEQMLDSLVSAFNAETGFELCIITLDTTVVAREKFDELNLRIANRWGIGQKNKNNGALISISRGYRKMRIDNGLGTEKLVSDSETKSIIDRYFIPYFKTGQYYKGTLTGLMEFTGILKSKLK